MRHAAVLGILSLVSVSPYAHADIGTLRPTADTPVSMEYACEGGHTPGDCRITIQGSDAAFILPGRMSVAADASVAADELEYLLALFHLADFFSYPSSRPPTGAIVIDRPTETLTLKVGSREHAADCTDTESPYLQAVLRLFREMIRKQEAIQDLEAAVASQGHPLQLIPRFLQWHAPLRSQRDRASYLLNELLDCNSLHEVVHCDAGGNIDTIAALANARTVDILTGQLFAEDGIRVDVADALGSTGDPRAIPPLLDAIAAGHNDPRVIRALARLDCRAVLEEALAQRNIEALGYIGGDDRRARVLLESNAYGWFTERWPRSVAVEALARMGHLPTPTKAGLFAHILTGILILAGIMIVVVPRHVSQLLNNPHRYWIAAIGLALASAGFGILYMLHFAVLF